VIRALEGRLGTPPVLKGGERLWLHDERGIALITVLLITFVIATLLVGAAALGTNASLVNKYHQRQSVLESVADAGLEEARSRINGNRALYPESNYVALETNAASYHATGVQIPNVTRTVYVGPTGVTTGQYGVFGSVVVDVKDPFGSRLVRRLEIVQESFAKFAYFTDVEPSNISFGGGDQIYGPVHTNDYVKIYSSGATFFGPVTTAKKIQGMPYGTFKQGYTEDWAYIPFPETADLLKLKAQAQLGNMVITSNTAGTAGQATTRIEFVAIDLDGDGAVTGDREGFIKVYQSGDPGWVVADVPNDFGSMGLENSENCGHYHGTVLVSARAHTTTNHGHTPTAALHSAGRRCLLGGADSLSGGFQAADPRGQWVPWPGSVSPLLLGRPDAQYLWPINRALNPSFRGVIFVDGKVAISGVLRGHVTLAATGNIVIADDLTYATDPGAATCNDILGLFSGTDIVVADNTLNAPQRPQAGAAAYFTYDDTKDESIHAVVLALNTFGAESYTSGATTAEPCETKLWGRGCLYLTGGVIQRTRGAVGSVGSPGGTGYLKRYSYDGCASVGPPPYFPTTGHFVRGHYYEVNPAEFDIAAYFRQLTPR
jgi:hypothetical protein